MKHYEIKIVSGSTKEISDICKLLHLDLWAGVKTDCPELANNLAEMAFCIAPLAEIEVRAV